MAYQLALPAPESFSIQTVEDVDTDENDHRYVGLVNQAMTCYLNSLLQTLYMTPEFRNAIYSWINTAKLSDESKNIPMQLKKLFLLLQTSDKSSLETRDLTFSFGWENHDAYEQHDVQELCRVMFDALDYRFRKSDDGHATLIDDLYRGTLEDYVKCLTCQNEKVRTDSFYDLPLAIKPFGCTEAFHCIEDALREFTKPEILDGRNKYSCDCCQSDQDAEKGLRINTFPYILSLQLKRFDFNYQTMFRVKLNDRMTFPDYLDVNDFVHQPTSANEPVRMSYADATKSTKPPATRKDEEIKEEDSSTFKWLNEPRDSESVQKLLKRGPYIYELFSIMVHQGNASGGHYFAYIKNMDQDKWLCFNDTSVMSAAVDQIYRSFGGYFGGWASNANAYMLMYRQIDPTRNQSFIRTDSLPANVQELGEKMRQEDEQRHMLEQKALSPPANAETKEKSTSKFFGNWYQPAPSLKGIDDELIIYDSLNRRPTEIARNTKDFCIDRLLPIADRDDSGKETSSLHAGRTVSSASCSSPQSSAASRSANGADGRCDKTSDVDKMDDDEGVGLDEASDAGGEMSIDDNDCPDQKRCSITYSVHPIREPMDASDADASDFPEGPVEASVVPDLSVIRTDGRRSPALGLNSISRPCTPDFMRLGEDALGLSVSPTHDDSINVSGFNSPADRSPVISESGCDDDGSTSDAASGPPTLILPEEEEEKPATVSEQTTIPLPATTSNWTRLERPLRIQKASFSETD